MELQCDLCIVGAGYAGVNAYNAAVKYLPEGSTVVVIDPNPHWGGQWLAQYDFVRLHQPYPIFTAGERPWRTNKPSGHLATKTEIISHLQDIVKLATKEKSINLVELFGYEYTGHASAGGVVEVEAQWGCERAAASLVAASQAPPARILVRASRLIKALGLRIAIKQPLPVTSARINSLSPGDVLAPHWKSAMRFSDKPIFVIGSGKTAMDAINHLHASGAAFANRICCISGRGMWFIIRDVAFPTEFMARNFTGRTIIDWFFEMIELHDGDNEKQVYAELARQGFFHSAIPDPQNFALGISSRAEIASVRAALGPRIVKAHLLDALDCGEGGSSSPVLRLRGLDGKIFDKEVPAGSFIINSTDHFTEEGINDIEPIVSDDNLVLSPQTVAAFTGPGADLLTHAWFLGSLDGFWRILLRGEADAVNKHKGGMMMIYLMVINTVIMGWHLPRSLMQNAKHNPSSLVPFHRRIANLVRISFKWDRLNRKAHKLVPGRWTDEASAVGVRTHLGFAGNLDKEAAMKHSTARL